MNKNSLLNVRWKISDVIIVHVLLSVLFIIIGVIILIPAIKDFVDLPFNIIPNNLIDLFSKYWYLFGIIGIIEQLLFILGPILWIKVKKYGAVSVLGLKTETWLKHFLVGFLFGIGFRFIILLPALLLGRDMIGESRIVESSQIGIYLNWVRFVIIAIIGPIGESILFTGFTFSPFAKRFGIKAGAIITALFFVIGHLYITIYNEINFLGLFWFFLMEIIVIWLYWKRKSLFSAIGFHMAYNFLFILPLLLSFGKFSDKTPRGTIGLLFKYSQQANWTAINDLLSAGYLNENDTIALQDLFCVDNIKSIETAVLEKDSLQAKALITLLMTDHKNIGIEPIELVFQNNKWKIVYSDSLPQSLRNENYLSEDEAYIHNNLGYIYSGYGRYYKAIEFYEQAVRLDPNYVDALWGLGYAYAELGRINEALNIFEHTIHIEPNSADLHYNLGLAYSYLGYNSKALKSFDQAIHINHNHVEAYNVRGYIYLRIHQYHKAMIDFNKALEFDKENENVYVGLAIANYQLGNKKIAIENYNKAVVLDDRFADANIISRITEETTFYTESQLQVIKEILKDIGH